jgi:predicted N-formylglutamate amidohydrolase
MDSDIRPASLLTADEPSPFETVAGGPRPIVLVCDHASNAVPARLDGLGLDERHRLDHIAWDIGAAAVARRLADWFCATAVLGGYSRLVVDLNRALRDPSAFPEISDGVLVPGNLALGAAGKAQRTRELYAPYHAAVGRVLDAATTPDEAPVLLAIHSFTPRQSGIERPWHVGVLWDKDPRLPLRLLAKLRHDRDVVVGDNEPYSGRHPADYTIDHHAEGRGIAHVGIEIRQDLIRDDAGQARWAERLADALRDVLDDSAMYRHAAPGSAFAWREAARLGGGVAVAGPMAELSAAGADTGRQA